MSSISYPIRTGAFVPEAAAVLQANVAFEHPGMAPQLATLLAKVSDQDDDGFLTRSEVRSMTDVVRAEAFSAIRACGARTTPDEIARLLAPTFRDRLGVAARAAGIYPFIAGAGVGLLNLTGSSGQLTPAGA